MQAKAGQAEVTIRRARPEDAEACGPICFQAFFEINTKHGFPPDFPEPAVGIGMLRTMFSHPGFFCVVAEQNGRIVGSNCMDERASVFGIGPITVDPAVQNKSIGRKLMRAVIDRGRERNAASIRLLQSTFHNRSLSLYTKLGFVARELISVMQGPPLKFEIEGCGVRAAVPGDLEAANRVCENVHGHIRSGEFAEGVAKGKALVVERQNRITGYASELAYFAHAAAESNLDMQALIASAPAFGGPGILVPTRNTELFRWCLEKGLRVVQPLTLMTTGLYSEPRGAYLPSILY